MFINYFMFTLFAHKLVDPQKLMHGLLLIFCGDFFLQLRVIRTEPELEIKHLFLTITPTQFQI